MSAKIVAKHGKSKTRCAGNSPTKHPLELVHEDNTWRSLELIRWDRGFSLADAPPDLRFDPRPLQRLDTGCAPVV